MLFGSVVGLLLGLSIKSAAEKLTAVREGAEGGTAKVRVAPETIKIISVEGGSLQLT